MKNANAQGLNLFSASNEFTTVTITEGPVASGSNLSALNDMAVSETDDYSNPNGGSTKWLKVCLSQPALLDTVLMVAGYTTDQNIFDDFNNY